MVFGLLLPETANEVLPQTIEEANLFGTHQSYFHCIMFNKTAPKTAPTPPPPQRDSEKA